MTSHCKLLGLLTSYQVELLKDLVTLAKTHPQKYWRPKDLGAFRNSHHGTTLRTLESRGFIESVNLSKGTLRPGYGYRATAEGIRVYEEFRLLADIVPEAVMGFERERRHAAMARQVAFS